MQNVIDHARVVLIPSYEPKESFINLVCQIKEAGFEIVVVNDGSGPVYKKIFDALAEYAYVINYLDNCGKGRALKIGLEYINNHYHKNFTVVTMDSDGQHRIEDALKICEEAEKNKDAIILGSRRQDVNSPLRSRFGNCVTRNVYRFSTGLSVYDTQTGLRAFSKNLIPFMLKVNGERFEYEMNVLLEASRNKIPITEIDIKTVYIDNNSGSHFNSIKDSFRIYKEILKFIASSIAGFFVDYFVYSLMIIFTAFLSSVWQVIISNIIARVVSATVNFNINYKLVFESKNNIWLAALKYFLLAVVILAGNTYVLNFIVTQVNVNPFLGKIITELIFFVFSWLLQRFFVFGKS